MPDLPEVSFASYDPTAIEADLIARYEDASGRVLGQADPIRLFLQTIAAEIIQERFLLDDSAKQCLLRYARSTYLDSLGDLVGVTRLTAVASSCTLQFTLSVAPGAGNSLTIPAGTRVSKSGTQLYWATDADLVIEDLDVTGTVAATCQTAGLQSNGFAIGEITTLVDVVAGVASVTNTTAASGGSDAETDDNLRERIRLAPAAFSTAGSKDAYAFWARSTSPLISGVEVVSPSAGAVDVYVMLSTGLPDAPMLAAVEAVLSADTVRPFTDSVTAKAPTPVDFTVDITYYIRTDDLASEAEIDAAVANAVEDYIAWQTAAIGRDVNPSELISRVMAAGAKRVTVTTPVYAAVAQTEVATLDGEASVTDGGSEDE